MNNFCFEVDELLDEALYDDAYLQEERNDAIHSILSEESLINTFEESRDDGGNSRVLATTEYFESQS